MDTGPIRARAERFTARLAAAHPLEPLGGAAAAAAYSLFSGGKRVRPVLAELACECLGGTAGDVFPYASALEMIHTYSLIHDDLPAMDDDDLRRGRPTCHKVHGEARAILAGDGLLTLAFEVALSAPAPAERNVAAALELSRAAGFSGMVGGQDLDMAAEGATLSLEALERLHSLKTGRLLGAATAVGALAAGAAPPAVDAWRGLGRDLGLLFQVVDDLLDATGDTAALGKKAGADAARRKATYATLLGAEACRAERDRLLAGCLATLGRLAPPGRAAEELAGFVRLLAERTF